MKDLCMPYKMCARPFDERLVRALQNVCAPYLDELRLSMGLGFLPVSHKMRGPAGTRRGGVSMTGGREGQGAGKGNGLRGHRLPSPTCFFLEFTYVFRRSVSIWKVASEYLFSVYSCT